MQRRHNVLLRVSVLLIIGVQLAASQSDATPTVPTSSASLTSIESRITATAQEGERVGSSTVQESQVVLSTVTDGSSVSISTETVLVTTVSPNTVYVTTSADRQTDSAPTSNTTVSSATTAAGDVSSLTSTANTQPEDERATTGKQGLSAGAKAGIAVGSVLGAVILAGLAYFCFKARSEARPRANTLGLDSQSYTGDTQSAVGASDKHPEGSQAESSPEQMTQPAYAASNRLSDHMNLTGIVFEDKDDSPMYVGVPTHLTGSKRWSKPELEVGQA